MSFTAIPDPGYSFRIWQATGSMVLNPTNAQISFQLTANTTLAAVFQPAPAPTPAPATHWKGQTNSTWSGQNWAGNVNGNITATTNTPNSSSNITLSAPGAQNQTPITLDVNATIKNLTVNATAGLSGNKTLTVTGNTTIGNGNLTLSNGVTLSSNGSSTIAQQTGENGSVSVNGGNWTNNNNLTVGGNGTGSLAINGGSVSGTQVFIGNGAGSTGTATVTGGTWTLSNALQVGNRGNGTLLISGGIVSTTSLKLAVNPGGSTGNATVSGGNLTINGITIIGQAGNGTLLVNGGNVSANGTTSIGYFTNGSTPAVGALTVTAGSFTSTSDITVGKLGTGTLNVAGNGTVSAGGGAGKVILGSEVGAGTGVGTLNIGTFGGNSTAGTLNAAEVNGGNGTATVNFNQTDATTFAPMITGSAKVNQLGTGTTVLSGNNTYNGTTTVKSGTLALSSTGSINHPMTSLTVGAANGDNGTLLINGGSISSSLGIIGNSAGSRGLVTFNSGNWTMVSGLAVGSAGTGILNLNGGRIENDSGAINGAASTATITGGTWVNNSLTVGYLSGTGTLAISGGLVSSNDGILGYMPGVQGSATISGGTWANANSLNIGYSGNGTLSLTGSGTVGVGSGAGSVTIANQAGSVGTLNLGTGTNVGTLNASEITGGAGTASVNVNQSGNYTLAQKITGSASLNIIGPGTTILTGTNTYSGKTSALAGNLLINGNNSGATGAVTVGSGAILGGNGTIGGAITVQDGGTLRTGNGTITTLAGTTATFQKNSLFALEGNGAFFDQLTLSGAATILSGAQISFSTLGALTANSYTLLSAASGIDAATPFTLSGLLPSGYSLVYSGTALTLKLSASPANAYWKGGIDANWNTLTSGLANWATAQDGLTNAGGIPGAATDVTFSANGSANQNTTLGADFNIRSLTVNSPSAVTIGGANTLTITGTNTLTVGSGTGLLTISANSFILGGSSAQLDIGNNAGAVISSVISGSSNVVKSGSGNLTLSGNNSYTGGTIIKAGTLQITGTGAINHTASDLVVGELSGDNGNLVLSGSGNSLRVGNSILGQGAGSEGSATLNSGNWTNSSDLVVANSGNASLFVNGGKISGNNTFIGNFGGASGTGTITGGNLTSTKVLNVGNYGNGTLLINGGVVSSQTGNIGNFAGSTGNVTMTSGNWTTSFNLSVGNYGNGTLRLNGGNITTSNSANIGNFAGSSGIATVMGGTWANTQFLLGNSGNGSLLINGGKVTSVSNAVIANTAGSVGTMTVTSGNFTTNGALFVGSSGNGSLLVNGGNVSGANGVLIGDSNAGGSATVTSGNLTTGASLTVGASGIGTLLLNGGNVTSTQGGIIGNNAGSNGTATVAGGTWNAGTSLVVGKSGTGTLLVTGGQISNGSGTIGNANNSKGNVTVTGGTWTNNGSLTVGNSGNGTLAISGNGLVSNTAGTIGSAKNSKGSVSVTGGNWTNSGDLSVGSSGNGTLTVNGGTVTNVTGFIGYNANSQGTATVSSGTWASSGTLYVGFSGNGTLNLTNSGVVSATFGANPVTIGNFLGSVGTLNLGTGTTAGTLNATTVNGGAGTATVNFNQSGSYTFAPNLTGTLAVNAIGSGNTTLTGTNTYSGNTTISAGKLAINGNNSGATGAVLVQTGGTLGGNGMVGGAIAVQSGGTLAPGNLIATLTGTTATFQTGSLFALEGNGAFFDRLTLSGAATIQSGAQISFTLLGTLTQNSYTLLSAASGLDGTTKFTLSGVVPTGYDLQYTGTALNLVLSGPPALPATHWLGQNGTTWSGQNWASNAAGNATTSTPTSNNNITFSATGAQNQTPITLDVDATIASLTVNDTVGISGNKTLTVAGRTTIDNGNLTLSNGVTLKSNDNVYIASTRFSNGSVNVDGGIWTITGTSLSVGETGSGTLSVTGNGSISSVSTLLGGGGAGTGTLTVSGGNFQSGELLVGFGGNGTLNVTGGGTVGVGANGDGTVYLGLYGGVAGTLNIGTFGGNSTAGTINVGEVNGGAGTATLNFNQTNAITFAPKITGSASVNQFGTGTTTLTANSTYSGPTSVSAGALYVNGNNQLAIGNVTVSGGTLSGSGKIGGNVTVQSGGTITAGSNATSTGYLSTKNLSFASGSTALFQFAGTSLFDQIGSTNLFATGNITLSLQLIGSYVGAEGDTFKIFDSDVYSPGSANFALTSNLGSQFQWDLTGLTSNGTVKIALGSAPGFYWTGAQDANWNTNSANATNWSGVKSGVPDAAALPGASDDVFFTATGAANLTTTLGQDFTIKSLTFNDSASGNVTIGGSNTLTINGTAGKGITVDSGAPGVTISSGLKFAGASDTIAVNNANGLTIAGNASFATDLNKTGNGTLAFSGGNSTVNGNFAVNGGSVSVDGAGSILTAVVSTRINNGTLTVGNNGTANVGHTGTGTLSLAPDSGGNATINIGTFGGNSTSGILAAAEVSGGNGTAVVNFNQTNNFTFAPIISGSTAVNQLSNATTTLTGNSTYTGGTTIAKGTLQIGAGGTAGGILGNVALTGGPSSNLAFNRSDTYAFGGNITGTGSVLQNGNGTTVLIGTSNYTGGTAVNAGTLEVSGTGNVTGGSLFMRNGTYNVIQGGIAKHIDLFVSDTAGTTSIVNVNTGGNLTATGPIFIGDTGNGTMNVSGSGSKVAGSSTTFIGRAANSTGTLNVTDNATYSTSSLFVGNNGQGLLNITSGGRVTSGTISVGTTNGSSGTITLDAGTLNGGQLNLGQSGSGNLTALHGSTVNATGGSTFIGNTAAATALFDASNFNAGQLYVGSSANGSLTMRNGSVLTTNSGNAFIAAGNTSGTLTISGNGSTWLHTGVIYIGNNGDGTLNVLDGGVVTSGGGNAFVGAGNNSKGTLLVDGKGSSYTISGTDDFAVGGQNSTVTISNGGFLETKGRAFIAAGGGTSANVTVTGAGSRWRSLDYISVGQLGTASLTVADRGVVQVGNTGTGTVYVGDQNSNHTLNIGAGAGAGIIEASAITGGFAGTSPAVVNFNHTDANYFLTNTGNSTGTGVSITGNTKVNFIGNGTTTLVAANTCSGPTTVSAGTLYVNGDSSAATGEVTVSGGTLGGNGKIGGNVTIQSGAKITAGSSADTPGTLTLGNNLSLLDGSTAAFRFGSQSLFDSISLGGAISLTGSVTLSLQLLPTYTPVLGDSFKIFSFTNPFDASGFSLASNLTGFKWNLTKLGSDGIVSLDALAPTKAFWNGTTNSSWNYSSNATTNWVDAQTGGVDTTTIPGQNSDVIFTADNAQNLNTTLGEDLKIYSLTANTTTAITIGGANTLTILGPKALTVADSAGLVTISTGGLILPGITTQFDIGTSASALITTTISGASALEKSGVGTLILTGSNTYTGGTTISGGILQLGDGGTTGSVLGNIVDNDTLVFKRSDNLTFSDKISGTGSLIQSGSGTLNLTGSNTYAGGTTVRSGTLELSGAGSITHANGNLVVGSIFGDNANLLLLDPDSSLTAGNIYLGRGSGSTGFATVTKGKLTSSADALIVGAAGTGNLLVNGGFVSSNSGTIGNTAGSNGTATVTSGTWANSGILTVGSSGSGQLNISGGLVSNTQGFIGDSTGSQGTATVSGGTWGNSSDLFIGKSGTGTLLINGGTVSNINANIGSGAGSSGNATVSSGAWLNSGTLTVGASGNGTLNVTGGTVSDTTGTIGGNAGSNGAATVSGGNWTNTAKLIVGGGGLGTLDITGGLVTSGGGASIGAETGSVGRVTVSGNGTLQTAGGLIVGDAGNGTLNLQNGGLASVANGAGTLTLGAQSGSTGTLNIGAFGGNSTSGILAAAEITGGNGSAVLNFNQTNSLTFNATITGSTSVNARGGATTLGGNLSYSGLTTITGTILNFTGSMSGLTGNITNGGTLGLLQSADTTYNGTITGTGNNSINKSGNGTVTLGGAVAAVNNTYISVGTLNFTGNMSGLTGNILVGDGATLGLGQSVDTTYNGSISGAGNLVKFGSGTTTIGNLAPNYTGTTTIQGGTLNFAVDTSQLTGNIVNDGVLQFSQSANSLYNGHISGNGSVRQNGSATLALSGNSTYTGGTTVNSGVLQSTFKSALGTGPLTVNGGIFRPTGGLTGISALNWNGNGTIAIAPAFGDFVTTTGAFTGSNGAGEFLIGTNGLTKNTYTLVNFDTTNFNVGQFSAIFDQPGVNYTYQFVLTNGNVQIAILGATASGNVLYNNPNGIPTFGDFTNTGNTTSGLSPDGQQETKTIINSLINTPGSSLDVPDPNTLLITGNGPTSFVGGSSLNLDGTLIANQVIIGVGAVMTGHGVLVGDLFNGGNLAPGNSPGTLTVAGNFVQSASGTLEIEVASPTVFDQLFVGGTASLAGTLQVQSYGGCQLQYGQQFTFLHAAAITGQFDTITTSDPSIFRARFLQNGGTGTILIAPTSYTLVAETQNQRNVAKALDSFIKAASGDRQTVSIALDLQAAAQYPAAFDAIAPTFYESLTDMTIEQTNSRAQMLAQRASAVRLGARGFQAIGIEAPLKYDKDGRNVMDAKDGKNILSPAEDNKWGVWVQGNGIFARATSVGQVPSYNFQNGGFLAGADYQWSKNLVTGVYAGYQGTYAEYSNGGATTINAVDFGLYAGYQSGGFYADAIIGGGSSSYAVRRPIKFSTVDRTATSRPDGGQFTSYLGFGYDWQVGNFTIGPVLSGQYTYAGIAPFSENGAGALDLAVGQQNANSLRSSLGGRIAYTWKLSDSISLIPEGRLFWQHEFLENPTNIGASLDGGNGPSFNYTTSAPARDAVFAAVGISAQFGPNWSAYLYYNADFGRQDYISHSVTTGLNFKF